MTAEAPKPPKATQDHAGHDHAGHDHEGHDHEGHEHAEPLNREERRALARGKKGGAGKQQIGSKNSSVRSQMPKGGPGKFQLPTKNG